MALGRNQRLDPRRSQYCSTTTIVLFVALCLVGVWMMTSTTVVPADVSTSDNTSEVKQEVSQTDANISEDSKVNIPDDANKGDTIIDSNPSTSEPLSESPKEKIEPEVTAEKGEVIKTENEDNEDVPKEGGDAKPEDENGNTTNNDPEKSVGENSDQTNNKEHENNAENNESGGTTEQNSDQAQNKEEKAQDQDKTDQTQNIEEKTQDETDQTGNSEEKPQDQTDQTQNSEEKTQDQNKTDQDQTQQVEHNQSEDTQKNSNEEKTEGSEKVQGSDELLPSGGQSEMLNETNAQNGAWSTQAAESKNEKEVQASALPKEDVSFNWKLCNKTTGADYIPCLDNEEAIKKLTSRAHFEHRERHCPETPPTCLVPLPEGYKKSVQWPYSRDKIWYSNVPHIGLAAYKGHQNWVKVTGEYLTFPGGGTQFIHGALHYIDVIQKSLPDIAWGKRSRVVLDVGCGVASFGGYMFDRDVITMSFAPKDEHEAQVQFALERGIPAMNAVMGSKRLPFPGRVFDIIHCARCRVPWHVEGGKLLLELNRLLRPGGYFVWSATPVYRTDGENVEIWKAMKVLTKSMCWKLVSVSKDDIDGVGIAIYKKPSKNACYDKRKESNPPLCRESDDPNAAWYVPLQACMHKLPVDPLVRGTWWPEQWPLRLERPPYWLNSSQVGVYGKPAPEDFKADQEHWNVVVSKSYLNGMGIDWSKVRNVMDMRSVYGGFAAALRDMKLWVMNIVPIDSPDTLPIIYERGLFGMYHDWCEAHSTYPRTYDLLHADHLFSSLKQRCNLLPVIVEVDRILRPEGKLIVRDSAEVISEVENIAKSLNYEIRMSFSKQNEGVLCVMKTMWRPNEVEGSTLPMS